MARGGETMNTRSTEETHSKRAVINMLRYAGCKATPVDGRVVFTGPSGEHSLELSVSSVERILAHWHGFAGDPKNGGSWARVRAPIRGTERLCDLCDGNLGLWTVATDHGAYCSGACADEAHADFGDGDAQE